MRLQISCYKNPVSLPVLVAGFFVLLMLFTLKAEAATLINASNTISTSRPSASSPLSSNASSTDTIASIFDNGSFFLASDSAKIVQGGTGAIIEEGIIVASQSGNLQTVFFGQQIGSDAGAGSDILLVPITAMHKLQFRIPSTIPVDGKIILTFPVLEVGDADNSASASATTFQMNNLTGSQIMVFDDSSDITSDFTSIVVTDASSGSSPTIEFTLDSSTSIAANSIITIYLGCTAGTDSSCSTQVPRIINPTKTASTGTADIWKINIQTQDGGGGGLDEATISIGTIESVTVRATVDPTLTFTIAGILNGVDLNDANPQCGNSETTNSGINSTATEVNLGLLANTPPVNTPLGNIAGQTITVTTNGPNGYTLTATSSGSLTNPATGFFLNSDTTPTAFPGDGSHWFGLHACGLDVDPNDWTTNNDADCITRVTGTSTPHNNLCQYAWPNQTSPLDIASESNGPIGNAITAGNGIVSIAYAASVDPSVPPGEYRTIITYVATPAF